MENNLQTTFMDIGYLNFKLNDYLSETEFAEYELELDNFKLDLDCIKSDIIFLSLEYDYKTIFDNNDEIIFVNSIFEKKYITYKDYLKLIDINKKYNFPIGTYANLMLTSMQKLDGIKKYLNIAYKKIIFDLYNIEIPTEKNMLMGHMNVYPKNSYIRKHRDGGNTIATTLFFLNRNRKYEDGSLFVLYDKNKKKIEIVPDYNTILILNHSSETNLLHEVSENLIDDVRLSLYTPLEERYLIE
jgi:Rps23 Pro-64 3,4-dihydroxylase Tpa1-like proline 4-hydroxylase